MRTNVNKKPWEHNLHYIDLFCRLQVFSLTFLLLTILDCSSRLLSALISCILTFLQINLRSLLSNLSWWSCKGLLLVCPPPLCFVSGSLLSLWATKPQNMFNFLHFPSEVLIGSKSTGLLRTENEKRNVTRKCCHRQAGECGMSPCPQGCHPLPPLLSLISLPPHLLSLLLPLEDGRAKQ
jgi:hypothetical protein